MAREKSFKEFVMGNPLVYRFVMSRLGTSSPIDFLISEFIRPATGMSILDVGCGDASILHHLGDVHYTGIDHNPTYIAKAINTFGERGRFVVADVSQTAETVEQRFDRVLLLGVLHHLTDEECDVVLRSCASLLVPNGALITFDCALTVDQHWVARVLAKADRGRYARSPEQYSSLIERHLSIEKSAIRHDLLRVPYTHFTVRACT